MSALAPAQVREYWRRWREHPVLEQRLPYPPMTPRIATLVQALDALEPEEFLKRHGDATGAEFRTAVTVWNAHHEREQQRRTEMIAVTKVLLDWAREGDPDMETVFARWSAAHPEPAP